MSGARALAAVVGLLFLGACASAYQRTYEKKTQELEQQQKESEAAESARHQEASRYAAVVYFDVGSSVLGADGYRELGWFVDKMRPYPEAQILVQGFADTTGKAAENQKLSEARARAVAQALVAQGIAESRLVVQGFGTESPAAANTSAAGRRKNRRVEVTVR
jgi:outer membrane protein OmpA-like peptidoglycan-associated protein